MSWANVYCSAFSFSHILSPVKFCTYLYKIMEQDGKLISNLFWKPIFVNTINDNKHVTSGSTVYPKSWFTVNKLLILPSTLIVISNAQGVEVFLNMYLFHYFNAKHIDNSKQCSWIVIILVGSGQEFFVILSCFTNALVPWNWSCITNTCLYIEMQFTNNDNYWEDMV